MASPLKWSHDGHSHVASGINYHRYSIRPDGDNYLVHYSTGGGMPVPFGDGYSSLIVAIDACQTLYETEITAEIERLQNL